MNSSVSLGPKRRARSVRPRMLSYMPLGVVQAMPLPVLADAVTDASAATSGADDEKLVNTMVLIIFGMLVYVTLGVVILTIDSFIKRRNDERSKEIIRLKLLENPNRKTMDDMEKPKGIDGKKGSKKMANSRNTEEGNRQARRMEKKMKVREERAEKRRKKLAEMRAAKKDKAKTEEE